jgi:hypothetical protein
MVSILAFSSTIPVYKVGAQITWRQRIEQRLRRPRGVDSDHRSKNGSRAAQKPPHEILSCLHNTRIKVCPADEWSTVGIKIRIPAVVSLISYRQLGVWLTSFSIDTPNHTPP